MCVGLLGSTFRGEQNIECTSQYATDTFYEYDLPKQWTITLEFHIMHMVGRLNSGSSTMNSFLGQNIIWGDNINRKIVKKKTF